MRVPAQPSVMLGTTVAGNANRRAAIVGLGAMVTAGLVVLHHLGTKPLWLDEAVSVSVAARPLARVLAVLPHRDANAGLYYLFLHAWLGLGHGAAWDRGPSAVCFSATAGVAAWAASRRRGPWVGGAAGILVVTNRFLVFYGQEARPYAAAVLLAVGSTVALFWAEDKPATGAYVMLTTLLLYTDLFAILFVGAQAGAVLALDRRRGAACARGWVTVAALTVPLAAVMMTVERGQIGWLGPPSWGYLETTVLWMVDGRLGAVVIVVLGGVALAMSGGRRDRSLVAALAAAFLVPPFLLWAFAQIVPCFTDRYVICSTVGALGLAALGFDILRRRAPIVSVMLLAAVAGSGASLVVALERAPIKYEDPPAVAAFLSGRAGPGDAVGFGSGGLRTVIDLYAAPGTLPDDIAVAPGGAAAVQADAYAREVAPAVLARRLDWVQRLWLVTDPSARGYPTSGPFAAVRPLVDGRFARNGTTAFPGMDVTLYTRVR